MFFNIKNNSKNKLFSLIKIVALFLVFAAISDKEIFFNMFRNLTNITNPNNFSLESVVANLVNISKVLTFDYSLSMGIGYMFMGLATIVLICKGFMWFVGVFLIRANINGHKYNMTSNKYIKSYRNIYLNINKFIC